MNYGIEFAKFGYVQSSEMWGINMLSIYVSFPLAGATWLLFLSEHIMHDLKLIFPTDDSPPVDSESPS